MTENIEKDQQKIAPIVTLHNGNSIPQLGFGTYQMDDTVVVSAIEAALNLGYRHIDTAAIYKNEIGVGVGIEKSAIPREKLFITSKVWNSEQGYHNTLKAVERSLERLRLDYLDLYLIHWPSPDLALSIETWKAFEELYHQKKVRSIGVSNFKEHHLEKLFETCSIRPMVNQVELHPQFPQKDLQAFCKKHDIVIESWAPLSRGKVFHTEPIPRLMKKYAKTAAQIILRWHLQQGLVVIPKSKTPARIEENAAIFNFKLSSDEMLALSALQGQRIWADPDSVEFNRKLYNDAHQDSSYPGLL